MQLLEGASLVAVVEVAGSELQQLLERRRSGSVGVEFLDNLGDKIVDEAG